MSQRKRKARSHKPDSPGTSPAPAEALAPTRSVAPPDGVRAWLVAATVALFVARPLFPSEAMAQSGEGIPLVMLSLLILIAWAVAMIRRRGVALRFGPVDAAILALLIIHSAAALWATHTGNARAALNVLWAWMGLGVAYFLMRQLVRRGRETRAVAAVMIALAVALSSYGLYQYAVELPKLRHDFLRDPDGMMRAEGIWYEPGSMLRTQFEQRLASREPFATFSLTNSLAGYLAPWLVVAVGLAVLGGRRIIPGTILIVATVGGCLLLTKSRSALLAAVLGLVLVGLLRFLRTRSFGWKSPLAAVAVALALVVGAAAVGGLDREVLSETGKSLGYRLQYWQSTLAMIGDRPWLGCGPGQFQNAYPAYKLPEASEEIADPHNFLLEVTATAGVPAGVAMLTVLGALAWSLGKRGPDVAAEEASEEPAPDATRWIYGGALAGFSLAWPMGVLGTAAPSPAMLALGLPLAAATLCLLVGWINHGRLPVALVAVGLIVLLVNLSAAGGIGFPGVTETLWLLVALGLTTTGEKPHGPFPRGVAWVAAGLAAGLAAACYWTAYEPVLSARGPMLAATFDVAERRAHLVAATHADPLAPDPPRQLAFLALQDWRTSRDPRSLREFERYAARAVELDPQSNSLWVTLGDGRLEIFEHTASKDRLASALDAYRRAIELYPNKAEYHAKLALALARDGQAEAARREAEAAYRLDERMPHRDKKMPDKLRQQLLRRGFGP